MHFPLHIISLVHSALAPSSPQEPIVDLGYATYQGYHDASFGLNIWKGIRYAAPPVGNLRWQAPVAPEGDNRRVIRAVDQPPVCPQSGAAGTPPEYGFNSGPGEEDCLFLNVYAAPDASDLPVLVWIHGGGYGMFGATYDPSPLMKTNDNNFITVEIQYRLGAFGFLSSEEVKAHGQTNSGLLDQRFALEWVQKHIKRFGGDPSRVTVGGESAGAGAVMLHALAYGGQESNLFKNIIAASPYSPPIYQYNDREPTRHYDRFADLAGCGPGSPRRTHYPSTFDCLVDTPTQALQNASGDVSTSGNVFGTFAFSPVIDEDFITARPSQQLFHGHVSGQRLLVGNNANDGVPLSNPKITTRDAFNRHIARTFPAFTAHDIAALNAIYQTQDSSPANNGPRFDTPGDQGPPSTALNQSEMATGLQQTAFNIFAESTFDCPAQWMAEAFSDTCSGSRSSGCNRNRNRNRRRAWKYQYSATPAYHGFDLETYFPSTNSDADADTNAGFNHAFQKIWGNFIINNTPVIPLSDATANMPNATAPSDSDSNPRHPDDRNPNLLWPPFTIDEPWQMDLNTTGGKVSLQVVTPDLSFFLREGPGIVNVFRLVDAFSWEEWRGGRCEFWREVAERVPL
ncbi:putative carboxylesterase [Aspergillus lucknowensis]|uniref:Carboxylic ester hydrolase n=1 Tax=Aspergillus lucknowensis TaxID=176173 RepID=A0ABR4LQB7_9EURO